MSQTYKQYYAVIAGLCASAASFFGKLSSLTNDSNTNNGYIQNIQLLSIIYIILMIICNGMVWTFFVKALHTKGGSLVATVLSAATNYSCSAILGCFIFKETTSILWWFGTFLVICGLVMLLYNEKEIFSDNKMKKN